MYLFPLTSVFADEGESSEADNGTVAEEILTQEPAPVVEESSEEPDSATELEPLVTEDDPEGESVDQADNGTVEEDVSAAADEGLVVTPKKASAPLAPLASEDATVQINFAGIDGVTVQYGYGPYTTPVTDASGSYTLVVPALDVPDDNLMTIRLMKGGMYYSKEVKLKPGDTVTMDVPVSSIQIIGIASTCNLGIGQNDWVYRMAPADVGVMNEFFVFDNGEPYYVRLLKDGFHEVVVPNVMPGGPYVYFGPDYFQQWIVPADVSNVWIASNSWAVKGANTGDKYTLLSDAHGTTQTATMTFEYGGVTYTKTFLLDGKDPFEALEGSVVVNFPGVEGVTLQYYAGGVWADYPGTFDSTTGLVKLPTGVTSLRVVKGGMNTQLDGVTISGFVTTFDIPTIELWAMGTWAEGCTIGVVQNNWVYQDVPGVVSGTTKFMVFDNGKDYKVRLNKPGFYTIERTAISGEGILYVYFAETVFYQAEVPAGVSDVRMQSNNWIVNPAQAGDKIDLLQDKDGVKDAKMTFVWKGITYTVNFKLDGNDPFKSCFNTVTYDGNGGTLDDGTTDTVVETYLTLAGHEEDVTVAGDDLFTRVGYKFAGWEDASGNKYTPGDTFTMPAEDLVLLAQWEKDGYDVIVNFTGIQGVTVQYNSNVVGWVTVGVFDDTSEFVIPKSALPTWGDLKVRVSKAGMIYVFDGVDALLSPVKACELEVPIITLRVMGLAMDCNRISVAQSGANWIYSTDDVAAGTQLEYKVFDNGKDYYAQLSKSGFWPITSLPASRESYNGEDELWIWFSDQIFYEVTVPAGIKNVWMQSNSWIVTRANEGDKIELLADVYGGFKDGILNFEFGGKSYTVNFKLDGTDPFAGMTIVNFPGVEGVTVQYYVGGVWQTYPGTFDNTSGIINLPKGTTSVRAVKAGMYYQFDGVNSSVFNVFDVPVIPLRVFGIATDCNIGVYQGDWVYPTASAAAGKQQLYNVFDNGRNYTAKLSKAGFFNIDSPAATRTTYNGQEELWIYFDDSIFYVVTVPEGVTKVRMQSNNWIVDPANEGDTITLLRDVYRFKSGAGWRDASMTFVWKGVTYNVDFKLDGSNPFDFIFNTITYYGNGGTLPDSTDVCVERFLTLAGHEETATIIDSPFEYLGYDFIGWNTKQDGTGTDYPVGSHVVMTNTDIVLYAQWEKNGYEITVNFPGVKDVTIQYYSNVSGGWVTVGSADDTLSFVLPKDHKATYGVTSVRAVKDSSTNGMSYTFELEKADLVLDKECVLDVPIIELWVVGIWADGCKLGVVQNNWVYQNAIPIVSGPPTVFNVFNNGKDYMVRLDKPGFYTIERTAVKGDGILYVHFALNVFYQAEVPSGISDVRMQSNNWIVNPAQAGDIIDLLKDDQNIRKAKMTFVWRGETYTVKFKLDGSDPFDIFKTVTYDANGATGGTDVAYADSRCIKGQETVTVLDNTWVWPGHTFAGWNTKADGTGTAYDPGDTFKMPKKDVTLYAQWTQDEYTISYDPGTQGTWVTADETYTGVHYGDQIPAFNGDTVTTNDPGWVFNGWDIALVDPVTGDATYVAQWKVAEYTVTFKNWDGTILKTQSGVPYGTKAKAPANPKRSGYTFTGWSVSFSFITSDLTVTAQFKQNPVVQPTPNPNPPQPVSPTPLVIIPTTVDVLDSAVLAVPPAPGTTSATTTITAPPTPSTSVNPVVPVNPIVGGNDIPTPGSIGEPSWALLNLILTVLGVLAALVLLVMFFINRKIEIDEEQRRSSAYVRRNTITGETRKKRLWPRIVSALFAVGAILLFIFTEDMTLPMVLTDQYTIPHIILLTLLLVFALIAAIRVRSDDETDQFEPIEAASQA